MSFGIETYNNNGSVGFSSTSEVGSLRIVDSFLMSGGDVSRVITNAPPPYVLILLHLQIRDDASYVQTSQSGNTVSGSYVRWRVFQTTWSANLPARILVCK